MRSYARGENMKDALGMLLFLLFLVAGSIMTFLKGYKYNERLRKQDQKGGRYITPNDSWLDEFFRIVVPYFPVNIAKFFYMRLGILLLYMSVGFLVLFLMDFEQYLKQ